MTSDTVIKAAGIITLGLASCAYLFVLVAVSGSSSRTNQLDGGVLWGMLYALIPFCLLLTISLLLTTARGALDWLPIGQGLRYTAVVAVGLSLSAVTFFGALGAFVPASELPLTMRPVAGWSPYVLPPVVLAWTWLSYFTPESSALTSLMRYAFTAASGVSLAFGLGACLETLWQMQQRDLARVASIQQRDTERDQRIFAEVDAMDPQRDFAELLGFTNRFETDTIRRTALSKAQSRGDFAAALLQLLGSYGAEKALVYLDCDEARAEDLRVAAPAFAGAVDELAHQAAREIEATHTFYPEQFDWNTRLILSVADKVKSYDVNPAPSVARYRKALNSERPDAEQLKARRTLDRWLRQNGAAP